MTHNIAKIRAALEQATGGRPSNIAAAQEALAALAELERALGACADLRTWFDQACEDIARMHDELAQLRGGVIQLRDDLREPAEREGGLFAHFYGRVQRMLLAHPQPAPVAEMREPTPEECKRIAREYYGDIPINAPEIAGSVMFDAVRAVMWPKEGL